MDGGETQKRPMPSYSCRANDDDAQMKVFWILIYCSIMEFFPKFQKKSSVSTFRTSEFRCGGT